MKPSGFLSLPSIGDAPPLYTPVPIKNEYADRWLARYEGKWRRVHIQVKRLYIVHRGKRITILIEGV